MVVLQGSRVILRPLELNDLSFLYVIENDITLWELSQTKTPFSKEILKSYLETSQGDIKDTKQLRLVITSLSNESLGFIDLFDFDAQNNRAGVSIVITAAHRNKGFGKDALKVLMEHSFKTLALHQLYSNILEENTASLRLFESVGFQNVGQKKEWRFFNGSYKSEYLLQYINHVL
ncbi:GNAT family N-acetyltransferase [Flavobacteriaceae bacterium]|nr:GNAT family N-acetyltransferase [Flavobacteriaceae bacterium]